MFAIMTGKYAYTALAVGVLFLHILFILWVVFGALFTRSRPWLRWFHIASLVWGIFTETLPWPCPLTIAENWLEGRAGVEPYQGGFSLHYLDALVYPNISGTVLHDCWGERLCTESRYLCTTILDGAKPT